MCKNCVGDTHKLTYSSLTLFRRYTASHLSNIQYSPKNVSPTPPCSTLQISPRLLTRLTFGLQIFLAFKWIVWFWVLLSLLHITYPSLPLPRLIPQLWRALILIYFMRLDRLIRPTPCPGTRRPNRLSITQLLRRKSTEAISLPIPLQLHDPLFECFLPAILVGREGSGGYLGRETENRAESVGAPIEEKGVGCGGAWGRGGKVWVKLCILGIGGSFERVISVREAGFAERKEVRVGEINERI